eukprot:6153763-Pleurochrysis_carterae.AAC.1
MAPQVLAKAPPEEPRGSSSAAPAEAPTWQPATLLFVLLAGDRLVDIHGHSYRMSRGRIVARLYSRPPLCRSRRRSDRAAFARDGAPRVGSDGRVRIEIANRLRS